MIKNVLVIVLALLVSLSSYGQNEHYTSSGYTSLIIKFSGNYPKEKPISIPFLSNPLLTDKPIDLHTVNDSTLLLSYYTFGPSPVYFFYGQDYCKSNILPNHTDILRIHYTDSSNYLMSYEGVFKEEFDHSKEFGEMIREALFSGSYFFELRKPGTYPTANTYRDDILQENQRMLKNVTKDIPSESVKNTFKYNMESTVRLWYLFNQYDTRAYREIQTDTGTTNLPLDKDISFYHGMHLTRIADIDKLTNSSFALFSEVRRDTVLNLPDILITGPDVYLDQLRKVFDSEINNSNNVFYDIMVAGAYMDHINTGTKLTEKQRLDVIRFFKNKHITNYILHHSDSISKEKKRDLTTYYLHYDKEKNNLLDDILQRYKGKVVIIDFWATWCGPCIEAFGKIKKVKEKFAEEDVVFVYLTDETSDLNKWNDFTEYLGGEQYYLYNNQYGAISNEFSIKEIPSYLVFGKDGRLKEKSLGGYMGNDTLTDWIQNALKDR